MTANLSGEFDLDLTLGAIAFEAYDLLQVASDGEPIDGDLFNRARVSLNIMLKLWETQGIHLWTFTEGSLFMSVGQAAYDFRNEGFEALAIDTSVVHITNEFTQRTLDLVVVPSQLTFTLDNVVGLTEGSQIGVVDVLGDLQWFIVMEIVGPVVTLSRPMGIAGAEPGAVVYTYEYFNRSELTVGAAPAAVVLDVADTTIYNVGDEVLIHLTDNSTDQREISFIDQGANQITITAGITSASGIGEEVINITTRKNMFKPVKRISLNGVRRRESTDYEIPIVFQSRQDYFDLPNKNQNGTPIQAYYDRQQYTGTMYVWNPPGNATSIINFTYERAIQISTDPDHTLDIPNEWYDAVIYNLAKRLIPKVGCSVERKADINNGATEFLDNALGFDQAVYPVRLKPQKYG